MSLSRVFLILFSVFSGAASAESPSITLMGLRGTEADVAQHPILIGAARAQNCRDVLNTCDSCTRDKTLLAWKQTYQIVAQQCAQEQQQKGCNQMAKEHPELKSKMMDCSPQAVCERQDLILNLEDTVKGCFWNSPGAFAKDTWETIASIPGAVTGAFNQCYGHPNNLASRFIQAMKCQSPLYYLIKGAPALANVNFGKIYGLGKKWVTDQGVKMSCYSPEAQTQMICYGIISVVLPTKVAKLKDVPGIIRAAGLMRKALPVAEDAVVAETKAAARTAALEAAHEAATQPRGPSARAPAPKPPRPVPKPVMTAVKTSPKAVAAAAGNTVKTPIASTSTAATARAGVAGATEVEVGATAARANFTEKFVNRSITTESENQRWVDLAGAENPAGTRFVDIENSAIKKLNDTTLDKNFVTALTNQHKEILQTQMKALEAKYANVEFVPYSDFKSVRYALRPRPPATSLPPGLQSDLNQAFVKANEQFTAKLKEAKVLRPGEVSDNWFRGGTGTTADEASLASRYARGASGPNELRNFTTDPRMLEDLGVVRQTGELFRSNLETSLAGTDLMEASSVPGKKIPRREVFDAVRKTQSNDQLIDFIKKTIGESITPRQASEIRSYAEMVDEFSPGIHIARREVASLADSKAGGFSIDFAGMGSFNGQATADALARSSDIPSALREARAGERAVTAAFNQKKTAVRGAVSRVLERHGISSEIVTSGDDMVVRPSKPIPAEVRREIAEELSSEVDPSSIRMSHVGGGVADGNERMIMATLGEACEKIIRKLARASIAPAKLNKVLILVEVTGSSSSNFSTNMVLGEGSVALTEAERQSLQSSSAAALAAGCK